MRYVLGLWLLLCGCAPAAKPTLHNSTMPLSSDEILLVDVRIQPELRLAKTLPVTPEVSFELKAKLRPKDSPDVLLLGFSGHCGAFCRTKDTWAYLEKPGDETGYVETSQAIIELLKRQGLQVAYVNLSSFVESHESKISRRNEAGYLDAQSYLDSVKETWFTGVVNPTRVILLAHSHGTVWATLLAMNNLDVTFDYFIYLDAVCWQWWAKHKGFVKQRFKAMGQNVPFPLDQGDPCQSFAIPGLKTRQDINDVVPANVIYGLEVRSPLRVFSLEPNLIRDDDPNVRINGSRLNIWTIESDQGHEEVNRRYGLAMNWVEEMILSLGLPSHEGFSMEQFVLPLAPEGFSYSDGE